MSVFLKKAALHHLEPTWSWSVEKQECSPRLVNCNQFHIVFRPKSLQITAVLICNSIHMSTRNTACVDFPLYLLSQTMLFTQNIQPNLKTDLGTPYCDHCHSPVLSNCFHDSKRSSKVAKVSSTVFPFITPDVCCLKQGDSFFSDRPFISARNVHWTRPSGPSFPSLSLFSSQPGPSQLPRHPCSCFCAEHEVWSVFPPSLGLRIHQALPPQAQCEPAAEVPGPPQVPDSRRSALGAAGVSHL